METSLSSSQEEQGDGRDIRLYFLPRLSFQPFQIHQNGERNG
jgi:hypothetical protein